MDPRGHVLLRLVFLLDLSHKHFDFFFEQLVALVLVILVSGLELDFAQVGVNLEQVNEDLFGGSVPLEIFVFLELQLLQVFVDLEGLAHQLKALRAHVTEAYFLDVGVSVTCFQNSEYAIVSQRTIFETYLFNWMIFVSDQSISDKYSSLVF